MRSIAERRSTQTRQLQPSGVASDRVIITSGLSKAFGMPGLRIGWVVAPPEFIEQTWIRHDYLTLTPGLLNDRIAAIAMEPARRERILARTRHLIRQNLPRSSSGSTRDATCSTTCAPSPAPSPTSGMRSTWIPSSCSTRCAASVRCW